MKVVCECGNEVWLNTFDEDTGEETKHYEDEGQYATIDVSKFSFWQSHDVVGIVCIDCDKSIWMFT